MLISTMPIDVPRDASRFSESVPAACDDDGIQKVTGLDLFERDELMAW